jgi:dienelactone hydrolase
MNDAKKPFDFVAYVGAVHAFSQSDAGNDPKSGAAYNEEADKQSFDAMKKFLSKLIG